MARGHKTHYEKQIFRKEVIPILTRLRRPSRHREQEKLCKRFFQRFSWKKELLIRPCWILLVQTLSTAWILKAYPEKTGLEDTRKSLMWPNEFPRWNWIPKRKPADEAERREFGYLSDRKTKENKWNEESCSMRLQTAGRVRGEREATQICMKRPETKRRTAATSST